MVRLIILVTILTLIKIKFMILVKKKKLNK